MSPPLATVRDRDGYRAFLAVIRARQDALNISGETLDDMAGLPLRYSQKILSGHKPFTENSLGPIMGALGIALAVVEDLDALERVAARLKRAPRNKSQVRVRAAARINRRIKLITQRNARQMAALRTAKTSPRKRSASARKAANARWRRVREARRATRNAPSSPHPASSQAAS
jgi:acyl-CoA reductase-like NAD-dependent aldehyde dehydrogenase